jgi:hypothetical protein
MHLAGVAQKELDIDSGLRSIDHVIGVLESEGCNVGSNKDYTDLIRNIRERRCVP